METGASRGLLERTLLGPGARVRCGWKILLFLALWLPLEAGTWTFLGRRGLDGPWSEGIPALLCAGLSWAFLAAEGRPLASLGLRFDARWFREFLGGALAGGGLILVAALSVRGLGGFHWVRAGSGTGLLAGLGFYLAVAAGEEVLFRGYAFQRAVEGMGTVPALALMALLFSWAHFGNPGMEGGTLVRASSTIFLAGLMLGLAWFRTRSLALPIGLHLGWNWAQGPLLGFGVSGLPGEGLWRPVPHGAPAWMTGGAFGLEASLPCAALCLAFCVSLALWKGAEREP